MIIKNLHIKPEDEPEKMQWHEAMVRFDNNTKSEWRLPTRLELLAMYMNKDKIGGFDDDGVYWCSSGKTINDAWLQHFGDGYQYTTNNTSTRLVRLVKKNHAPISGIFGNECWEDVLHMSPYIDTTANVLNEREKTHGQFASNAKISQELYYALMSGDGAGDLTDVQAEALKAICQKLARIVNGDASFEDHWVDIQGYCQLALEEERDD